MWLPRVVLLAAIGGAPLFGHQAARWHRIAVPGSRTEYHVKATAEDSIFVLLYSQVALGEDFATIIKPTVAIGGPSFECTQYQYLGRLGESVVLRRARWRAGPNDRTRAVARSRSPSEPTDSLRIRLASAAIDARSHCNLGDRTTADTVSLYVATADGAGSFVDPILRLEGLLVFRIGPAAMLHELTFSPTP